MTVSAETIRLPILRWVGRCTVLMLCFILASCKSSSHIAPIEQLDQPPGIKLNHYTVSRGDTLYSIAWRYGMDFHELASINNINDPYTIEVGQKIALNSGAKNSVVASSSATSKSAMSNGVEVVAVPEAANAVTEVQTVSEVPAATVANNSHTATAGSKKYTDKSVVEKNTVIEKSTDATSGGAIWQWPASGQILSRFSAADSLRKGIDIKGKSGEPVIAARGGDVVYAGSGLAGYGELIIVKHDEQFLSAYGHNSKLSVKEGDTVSAGQKIAEVGSSGTDTDKLHFEIRFEGKPVDPLQYLPKKK